MKRYGIAAAILTCVLLLAGCEQTQPSTRLVLPEDFSLPEVQIIAFGEATHGSAEFTLARQDIFTYLVEERGVRAFCLEADFGEGQRINDLLYAEDWDADSTAQALSHWVYRHEEMAALLQWMRDYNSSAAPEERVRFYGIDCQQWDDGKVLVKQYLQDVGSPLASAFDRGAMLSIRNNVLSGLPESTIRFAADTLDIILADLENKKADYCAVSEERDYDIALQAAKSLRQCLLMAQADPSSLKLFDMDLTEEERETASAESTDRSNLRDAFMAEHVAWVLSHEETYYGKEAIFVTGHNAHVAKSTPADLVRMGEHLTQRFAEQYFVIGSDFVGGSFQAIDFAVTGERKSFQLMDGPLTARFAETKEDVLFLSMADATGADADYFTTPQYMHSLGAIFADVMAAVPTSYLAEMTPGEAYDAVLLFRSISNFHSYS